MGRETPVLADLKPLGRFYMEDLHHAGGLLPLFRELKAMLYLDCLTVSGRTLGDEIEAARATFPQEVIRPLADPVHGIGGLAVLRGNLAPSGGVLKLPGASMHLLEHTGRAVIFESVEDLVARIDDPNLDVTPDDVLVLSNAGPQGSLGMPEAAQIPIPQKLARDGVRDMVRISDARMSGTGSGTVVLHMCPEAAVGGPLSRLRDGDPIKLDVPNRQLNVQLNPDEFAGRRSNVPAPNGPTRGYRRIYLDHVTQADEGCDFDVLTRRPFTAVAPV
jgi:dihydroxy-acid dehydratase